MFLAPIAVSETIVPLSSTSTAEGVPDIPNLADSSYPLSMTTGDFNPNRLCSSTSPSEKTIRFGSLPLLFRSHSRSESSMSRQNGQLGLQNVTRVGRPES